MRLVAAQGSSAAGPASQFSQEQLEQGLGVGTIAGEIDGVKVVLILLDTGADTSLLSRGALEELVRVGSNINVVVPK